MAEPGYPARDPALLSSLANSLILGISTAVLAVLLFSLIAYVSERSRLVGQRPVELMAWLPWAIMGLISLALVWLWRWAKRDGCPSGRSGYRRTGSGSPLASPILTA